MIKVSTAYEELVKTNTRPKCEPIITLSGKDVSGDKIEIIWKAKDIKNLKFERGIDPIGRELPYMELQWTEIYSGEFNSDNFPEKYNNVGKYMAVELSFIQDISFYNTWKTLYDKSINGGDLWYDLWNDKKTWKLLRYNPETEVIKMPKMFLTAKPTISGQTITWVARDLLFFLDDNIMDEIPTIFSNHYLEYAQHELENIIEKYKNRGEMYNAISSSINNVFNAQVEDEPINASVSIIVNMACKDFLLNYLNLRTYNLYFCEDGSFSVKRYIASVEKNNKIPSNILYSKPKLTHSLGVSNYEFTRYYHELQEESENYEVRDYIKDELSQYIFYYKGLGMALPEYQEDEGRFLRPSVNKVIAYSPDPVIVTPIQSQNNTYNIFIDSIGTVFKEDNLLNPYSASDDGAYLRLNLIRNYFKSGFFDVDFNSLSTLQYEPLDCVYIDFNLKDNTEKAIMINYISLEYNGSIKQTIKGHQIS